MILTLEEAIRRGSSEASGTLEIMSVGELHFGLTPEILFRPRESRPWNPLIASVFYRRGYIESWGRGTLKIAQLMQEAGLPAPTVKVIGGFVTVTFALARSSENCSEKSSEKILNLFRIDPGLAAATVAEQLGISPRAVERQIALLKKQGRLRRTGPAKGGRWVVLG